MAQSDQTAAEADSAQLSRLVHKEDDTLEDLQEKLAQLKSMEAQLQSQFQLLAAKEKEVETKQGSWRCVHETRIRFPHPILTAVSSASSELLAVVFEKAGQGIQNALIVLFRVVDRTPENPSGFQFCASLPVRLDRREGLCLDQCLCLHDGLADSSTTDRSSDLTQEPFNSAFVVEWKDSESVLRQELNTEKPMVCLLLHDSRLFLGGEGSRLDEWEWNPQGTLSGPEPKRHCRMPAAIVKSDQRLVGLSSDGAIFLWDLSQRTLLATFHPTAIRVHQLSPAGLIPNETPEDQMNVCLMAIHTKVHDTHENTSLTPVTINNHSMTLGVSFPVKNVQLIKTVGNYGLIASREGEIWLWNLSQGKTLWSTQSEALTSIMFDPISKSIKAATQQKHLMCWQLTDSESG